MAFISVFDVIGPNMVGPSSSHTAGAASIALLAGKVIFTRDTHTQDYLQTQEGRRLPVEHCIKDTAGWQIREELDALRSIPAVDKPTFGSLELGEMMKAENADEPVGSVTLIGLCTDICVISNAMIVKAAIPQAVVKVDAACCAGVTPESHKTALAAMKMCQIEIENENEE